MLISARRSISYPNPDGSDIPDVPTHIKNLVDVLDLDNPAPGYGTSLPGSPVNGQEYVLVDSTTNPTYQWHFRYNASSSSAYKWEFIGGSHKSVVYSPGALVAFTGDSTWRDPATPGPLFVVPRSGDYEVSAVCQTTDPTVGALIQVALWYGTSGSSSGSPAGQVTAANAYLVLYTYARMDGFAAGGDVRLRYWCNQAGPLVGNCWMNVQPVRVS
jgi:hypothetical protein